MQKTTGTSRRDGVVATTVALAVNGLIAWQLQMLLSPQRVAVDADAASLQVVWTALVPRRATVPAPARDHAAKVHESAVIDRPHKAHVRPEAAPPELPADPTPARPMSAVYLQQARQWAQQHPVATASADPFADRSRALPGRATDRFRMPEPLSVAIVVGRIGQMFGAGPDPCIRNRQDVAAYATGGDALALAMALDMERHCRP